MYSFFFFFNIVGLCDSRYSNVIYKRIYTIILSIVCSVGLCHLIVYKHLWLFCPLCSIGQCQSLYELIHIRREKTSISHRINIARQMAQAVGYLHARHIEARTLSSRNVFLDSRVKLSLIDHSIAESTVLRLVQYMTNLCVLIT